MKDTLYTLENHKSWKCMSYDGSNIYLSTKDKSTTDELIESCNSKKGMLSMEKTKVVSINGITKLAFIEKEDSIEIKSNELIDDLKFDSPESRIEICEELAGIAGLPKEENQASAWVNMKNTLGGGIIAILVGAVIYYEAMELEQGVVLDVSGRRAIVKLLFAKVALFLGTTGAAILLVAIVAIVLYLLYKKYKLENIQTVYQ